MSATYVIADLHGRFDLLCRAIDLIAEADGIYSWPTKIVVLGDFVDRGPQSRSIIDLLMDLQTKPHLDVTVLQGNHEAMMLEVLANPTPHLMRWWVGNGGGATLESYGYRQGDDLLPLKVPTEHLDWLRALPLTHEDDKRIYVHAGVPMDQHLSEAKPETLQWMLYREPNDDEYPDAEYYDGLAVHVSGKHIVHGHHQDVGNPKPRPGRTNLDSFAWNSGHLAIGVFDDDRPGPPVRVLSAVAAPQRSFAA